MLHRLRSPAAQMYPIIFLAVNPKRQNMIPMLTAIYMARPSRLVTMDQERGINRPMVWRDVIIDRPSPRAVKRVVAKFGVHLKNV